MTARPSLISLTQNAGVVVPAQGAFEQARRAACAAGMGKPPPSREAQTRAVLAQCEGDAELFDLVVVPEIVLSLR